MVLVFGLVLAMGRAVSGCGTNPPAYDNQTDGAAMQNPLCANPYPGCACSDKGAKGSCGTVKEQTQDFIECVMGTTTCNGDSWGPCEGDVVVDKNLITGPGVKLVTAQSLTGTSCGALDPCDPYCMVASGDGGLTITNTCTTPNNCNEATGPFSTVYNNLPGGNQEDPAPCTSGSATAADNCEYDEVCQTGSCTPYASGQTNPAPSCANLPDFTVGIGCCDTTIGCGNFNGNPNSYDIEVCNRGGVTANSGTLVIGINNGSEGATNSSGCTTGETTTAPYPGATYPSGPAIGGGGSNEGYCPINLATSPIAAGSCITLNIAASCTAMGGGSLDNLSGDHWVVANVPTSILTNGQASPLAECDTCNNFSALKDTSHSLAAFACTSASCGCSGGGTGPSTTTVSGTVYDPGANVPLPNITVYQPTGALNPFVDGVACDTCASINSPYTSVTTTDVHGNFTLPVTPTAGSANIVMQTGRWQRQITVNGIATGVNNPIPSASCTPNTSYGCQTRLPQTHAEGHIPKLAILTGSLEPFECDFAKFMGGVQTTTNGAHTLNTTASTLTVHSTTGFNPAGGTFYILSPGVIAVTYTGLTATTFTGCTTAASVAVANGAEVMNGALAEMQPPSGNTRIQLYQDTGASYPSPALPSQNSLYGTQADMNAYNAILLPCGGTSNHLDQDGAGDFTAAYEGYFLTYLEAGGGLFMDHDSVGETMQAPPPGGLANATLNGLSSWFNNQAGGGGYATPSGTEMKVTGVTATHTLFKTWLTNVGAYAGGYVSTPDPRERAVDCAGCTGGPASPTTFEWLRGETSDNWGGDPTGNYSLSFSADFNSTQSNPPGSTGVVTPGQGCGHLFYNGMHVDATRGSSSGNFPSECSLSAALSPNEMAFEYLIFSLTACSTIITPPPPPPPPMPMTYTSAIDAMCPVGSHVSWGPIQWQGTFPAGTNATFVVATAPDNMGSPGTYGSAVYAGQATANVAAPAWGQDSCTVSGHLSDLAVFPNSSGPQPTCITGPPPGAAMPAAGQNPQISEAWLQVNITLNPSGYNVPDLTAWQVLYDCPPTE
jgi:hypothetical protein